MAQFTAGLTEAMDSAQRRAYEESQISYIQTEIAQAAHKEQQRELDKQQRQRGIAAMAEYYQQTGQLQPQPSGPPLSVPPGQSSQPQIPPSAFGPQGGPPSALQMPQPGRPTPPAAGGAPQIAPQPQGWQRGPGTPTSLGGQPPQPGAAPGMPQLQPRPQDQPPPPQALDSPVSVFQWALKTGKSPEDAYAAAEAAVPIADAHNKEILEQMRIEVEVQKTAVQAAKARREELTGGAGKSTTFETEVDRLYAPGSPENLAARKKHIDRMDAPTKTMIGGAAGAEDKPEKLTEGGKKVAAELVRSGRPLPGGWSVKGMSRGNAILNEMALEEEGGAGSGAIAGGLAEYRANTSGLTAITKDITSIEPFAKMLDKNAEILKGLATKIAKTDSALANRPINWIGTHVSGNPDVSEFMAQMRLVQTEAARVITNPRLVGQLTDTARQEFEEVISGDMSLGATNRVLDRLTNDSQRRVSEMKKKQSELKQTLSGKKAAPPSTNAKGWALHEDKNGNQAYVSPDGKSFEEVK